jgi:serine/threonine-protein kinase
MMHTDGTNAAEPLLNSRYNETSAVFSPDARWLAYLSDESGRNEVYVRPMSGPGGKVQISSDGAGEPRWSPSGTELYFRSGAKMMSVPVTTGARFSAGRPTELFDAPDDIGPLYGLANFDVSRDGRRFLLVRHQAELTSGTLTIVFNWSIELAQLPR